MKYAYVLSCISLFSLATAFSQEEEDEYCVEPDKKVMKVLKEAEDPKNSKMDRTKYYTEAIDMAPNNAYTYYSFAEFNYEKANDVYTMYENGRANFQQLSNAYEGAAKAYKKVIQFCPEFHSDAYYKLGIIYYSLNDKGQASKYFKSFLAFAEKDPNKYADSYAQNKRDVEEILPEMEFFDKFYNNPVPYKPAEVTNVSSLKDEYLPMISPDNELIFYTRKGKGDNPSGIINPVVENFCVSQRKSIKDNFTSGSPLSAPFNTGQFANYGGVSLSLDNKEMFICACEEVTYQEHVNCDIYVTKFERSGEGGNDFTWTALENLGTAINTPDGWEAQPTLSADGNTLYFASWREGSQLTDIYYSTRDKNGKWSQAKPVPGPINSPGHDKAPFLHQDSETMYFVSDCSIERKGAGGSDVFYSRMNEDGSWSEPKNIGYPINSEGNEVGLVVSTDGKLAYYTSRNAGSKGYDIYYFELYEEARPQKVTLVKGQVTDESGNPVKDAKVEVAYKESGESVEVKVNGDDGKFAAIIKTDEPQDVMVVMKKEGYSFDTKLIREEELAKSEEPIIKDIAMEIGEIQVGKIFTIDDILYATSSYELTEDSKFILDQFVTFLKENPTVKVTIQGHTDDRGDASENLQLSKNRAKGVMDYIVSKGIQASRLTSEGYGETKPKVPNTSDANRAMNRRTDFKITGM